MSDDVGTRCDSLIRQLGGDIQDFSIAKRAQFPHIPDRRYYVRGVALWAELKEPAVSRPEARAKNTSSRSADQLTRGQFDFLLREHKANEIVFAGDYDMLFEMMRRAPSDWRRFGHECLAVIAARGFRKERAA